MTYNGEPMGVLTLFSEKRLKPIDFELIGIFCENVSKELSNFLDDQKFLFINQSK
ncbi:MAG: hypothetical protein M3M88_05400 [Thermoproteota archaeon]|nr:hypothetical protein [Thermoproteota archaeon]